MNAFCPGLESSGVNRAHQSAHRQTMRLILHPISPPNLLKPEQNLKRDRLLETNYAVSDIFFYGKQIDFSRF